MNVNSCYKSSIKEGSTVEGSKLIGTPSLIKKKKNSSIKKDSDFKVIVELIYWKSKLFQMKTLPFNGM